MTFFRWLDILILLFILTFRCIWVLCIIPFRFFLWFRRWQTRTIQLIKILQLRSKHWPFSLFQTYFICWIFPIASEGLLDGGRADVGHLPRINPKMFRIKIYILWFNLQSFRRWLSLDWNFFWRNQFKWFYWLFHLGKWHFLNDFKWRSFYICLNFNFILLAL